MKPGPLPGRPAGRQPDAAGRHGSGLSRRQAHWIRGFMAFRLARRTRIVRLMVPVGPKFGFRDRAVRPWRYWLSDMRWSKVNAVSTSHKSISH